MFGVKRVDKNSSQEDRAATSERSGLARGRGMHVCLSVNLEWREEGCKALEAHGEEANSAFDPGLFGGIPEKPTREQVKARLRHVFGYIKEDTESLIDDLDLIWDTFDILEAAFSVEDAQKMINAQPECASS